MELKDYITILLRRKWVIVFTVAVVLIVVFAGTRLQTPVYESSVTIRVSASASGQLSYSSTSFIAQLLNTTAQVATSSKVLDELATRLDLKEPPELIAEVIPNTELIKITVSDSDPHIALDAANTIVEILVSMSNTLYTGGGANAEQILSEQLAEVESELLKTSQEYEAILRRTPPATADADLLFQKLTLQQRNYDSLLTQYQQAQYLNAMRANMITVIEQPVLPPSPSSPRLTFYLLVGLAVGVVGGVVLAFVLDSYDTTLYTRQEIEKASGFETFTSIPRASKKLLQLDTRQSSAFTDSVQKLAYKLLQANSKNPTKVLLVISPEPRAGKTLTAAHLAAALAEHGKEVVAVDGNLRDPQLHQWLGVSNSNGLKQVLEENLEYTSAIQKTRFANLSLLPAGGVAVKPALLLSSVHMKRLVTALAKKYPFIVVDTPALLDSGDAEILGELADGFLLVVRRKKATREAVASACGLLQSYPDKFHALVVNFDQVHDTYAHRKQRVSILFRKILHNRLPMNHNSARISTSPLKPK